MASSSEAAVRPVRTSELTMKASSEVEAGWLACLFVSIASKPQLQAGLVPLTLLLPPTADPTIVTTCESAATAEPQLLL